MQNSDRRRKALVRSCACMRLESAIRTAMGAEPAVGGGVIRQGSERNGNKSCRDLRSAVRGSQGRMSHYLLAAFKSGKQEARLWKRAMSNAWVIPVDWESSGNIRQSSFSPISSTTPVMKL